MKLFLVNLFDWKVDHVALTYTMENKTKPASARNKRLLEVLVAYSVNSYYTKGKDITLNDFLPRIKVDKSKPHEIIPISFNMQKELWENYYIHNRYGAQKAGITIGKVHGPNKPLFPHVKLEKKWINILSDT